MVSSAQYDVTLNFGETLSREISVSSNLVRYGKGKPAGFLETKILCEAFRVNFQRKLGSSLCYHTISVRTCFCVCSYLIFRSAYLAYYCFCAMLFAVCHSNIVNIFCCWCYMRCVYLKSPMLYLRCACYILFSKTRQIAQYLNCGFCN